MRKQLAFGATANYRPNSVIVHTYLQGAVCDLCKTDDRRTIKSADFIGRLSYTWGL